MRIVFMGSSSFSVPSLKTLAKTKYKPILVVTQPDRKKGRKRKITPTIVKEVADNLQLPVFQPEDINGSIDFLTSMGPDIIVTVSYGEYLKKSIRNLPKIFCINLHPSLLPKYRGATPIQTAIAENEKYTGNTVFKITSEIDSGAIISQEKFPIKKDDNYSILEKKLSFSGAKLLLKTIEEIELNKYSLKKQDNEKATFTQKIISSKTKIDWNNSAEKIDCFVRSLAERPSAKSTFRKMEIKILDVKTTHYKSIKSPGEIVNAKKMIFVATKDFDLKINLLKPAGKNIMTSHAFNLGQDIREGEYFK